MALKSDRYLSNLIIDFEILCPLRRAGSLFSAGSIVGVPETRDRISLAIADQASASSRNQRDRIGGTLGELGGNGPAHSCACARAYTLMEYLIGRNNYRR